MSTMQGPRKTYMPDDAAFKAKLAQRHRTGRILRVFFSISLLIAVVALATLLVTIVDDAFGLVAVQFAIPPEELSDVPLAELSEEELLVIARDNLSSSRMLVYLRDNYSQVDSSLFTSVSLDEALSGRVPEEYADMPITELTPEQVDEVILMKANEGQLLDFIEAEVVGIDFVDRWTVFESIGNRAEIEAQVAEEFPNARVRWHSWVSGDFIMSSMSSVPAQAGIRTALLGTLWVMAIVILVSFPLGVGAAIYLEEYATDNWFNNLIETNIRNLAGVPSIIYGLLGLVVFVRVLRVFTSGAFVGITDSNGRTIISAALTLALLILPIIIINSQEALRAVSSAVREASYGLGATKWQTIWRTILPSSLPGILTGTILAISRAIGETAPLIVVGASTFVLIDPNGPFSKFTVLPIQIYQWTTRPQDQFKAIAAAAIIVLLVLLLSMNALAIYLRNRYTQRV